MHQKSKTESTAFAKSAGKLGYNKKRSYLVTFNNIFTGPEKVMIILRVSISFNSIAPIAWHSGIRIRPCWVVSIRCNIPASYRTMSTSHRERTREEARAARTHSETYGSPRHQDDHIRAPGYDVGR